MKLRTAAGERSSIIIPNYEADPELQYICELGIYNGERQLMKIGRTLVDLALDDPAARADAEQRLTYTYLAYGAYGTAIAGTYAILKNAHQAMLEAEAQGTRLAPDAFARLITAELPDIALYMPLTKLQAAAAVQPAPVPTPDVFGTPEN